VSRNSRRALATAVAGVFALAPMVTACAAGRHPQTAMPTRLTEGVNASAHDVDVRNAFVLGPAPGKRLAAGADAALYAWFLNSAAQPDRLVAAEAPGVAQSVQIAGGAIVLPPNQLVNTVEKPGSTPPSPSATPTPAPSRRSVTMPAKPPAKTPAKKPAKTPAPGGDVPNTTSTPAPHPLNSTTGALTPAPPAAAPATSSKLILKGLASTYSGGETLRVTLHFQQAGTLTLDLPVVPWNGDYATYSPAPAAPTPPPTPSATPLPGKAGSTPTVGKAHKAKAKARKPSATPSA
jgi:copper(I)-binding protein